MKNIIFIVLILTALSCKAQSPIVSLTNFYINDYPYSENIYVKDTEGLFDPYIDEWHWVDGNSSLTIIIEKVEMEYYESSTTKRYDDELYGRILYIENGIEIINTLSNTDEYPLRLSTGIPDDGWLSFNFKDPININKYGHVDFTLNNNQITFYLRNTEGIRVLQPGQSPENPDFSLPRRIEIVLNRQ